MLTVKLRKRGKIDGHLYRPGDVVTVDSLRALDMVKDGKGEIVEGYVPAKVVERLPAPVYQLPAIPVAKVAPKPLLPLWVVIPTIGRKDWLKRTLAAVFLNAPDNLLACVVDDASDDGTGEMLAGMALVRQGRVKVIHNPRRLGVNAARDIGIKAAPKDAVIVEVDDHDAPEFGALTAIAERFTAGADALYGDVIFTNTDGTALRYQDKEDYRDCLLMEANPLGGLRAYRREWYDRVGGYRADEFPAGHLGLFLRFAERGARIDRLAQPLCRAVLDEGCISVRMAADCERMATRLMARARMGVLFEALPEPAPPDFSDVKEGVKGAPVTGRVGVIIPLYRSREYARPLAVSLVGNGLHPEGNAVWVSDGDGDYELPGLVVTLSHNTGFAHACNVGAAHCEKSEYLCLLNADTQVTAGWLDPLVKFMDEHPDVAVVGPRIENMRGALDSLGSELHLPSETYQHVRGGKTDKPLERDMVTFACALIRRTVWDEIGGLDERFLRGYCEDADFCMKVKARGHRIFCLPASTITHEGEHSRAAAHETVTANQELFRQRWVRTGKVDQFARGRGIAPQVGGKIVACYIALNEAEYLAASIESVSPVADEIIVVEGGNEWAEKAGWCGPDRRSDDGTLDILSGLAAKDKRIRVISGAWKDKTEQRNVYARLLKRGDWLLMVDADEVFYEDGLWRMAYLMRHHDVVPCMYHTLWNNFQTVACGAVWDHYVAYKAMRWGAGYSYSHHTFVETPDGKAVTHTAGVRLAPSLNERLFAHYAWVKPLKKIAAKIAYYECLPEAEGRVRPGYMEDVFLGWRQNPKEIEQKYGTHPFGGGTTLPVVVDHPAPIARLLAAKHLGGEGW